jgi:hypothetical protein
MPRKKSPPAADPVDLDADSLDREIAILRDLIRKAAAKQTDDIHFDDQLDLLEKVGRAAPALARMLKARRDLANAELDPAAMLRQALLELEEEWPELKNFGQKYKKG